MKQCKYLFAFGMNIPAGSQIEIIKVNVFLSKEILRLKPQNDILQYCKIITTHSQEPQNDLLR